TSEPIALTAGSKYGILFFVKEGGGGDWGQVAMRKEGSTAAASTLTAIGGPFVTGKGDAVGAVVNFVQSPASQTVTANQSVSLSANVEASSPYGRPPFYQWYKNGSPIIGATSASYTIPVATAGDAGTYVLEVGVIGLAKKSADAVLTISTDTKKPAITGSEGFGNIVNVTFDEPVKANTATVTLSGGIAVSSVVQNGEKGISAKLAADMAPETSYTVTVNGLQDNAGNAIEANSTSNFKSWAFVANAARVRYFDSLSPSSLANLQVVRNTTTPTQDYSTNLFGAFTDRAENFGTILSGWIKPPTTGDYTFYISADDNAQLWLSTDENPANVKRIAIEPQWNGQRDWIGTARRNADAPENRSDKYTGTQWPTGNKITLTGGSRYYIEMIAQEGGGGDNSAIAVTPAAEEATAETVPISGAWLAGYFTPPTGGGGSATVSVGRDGANLKITFTGTLESADSVSGPWSAVAGATSPATITPSGAGKFYRTRQ
ncbi:MAG: Ig-like domain-containing protein, partial [Verrucomicrobiales bacterium]|nr:Ig-like domain-containing protein [Verrucomicrobiales bacterium]